MIQERIWNHLVLVRDVDEIQIYLNGNTVPEVEAEVASSPRTSQIIIGGSQHHQESFEGKIDEVSIYNRIISATEAAEHYQAARIAPAGQ